MTSKSSAADAARRLWARAAGGARGPEEVAAGVELLRVLLRTGLGRWIGAEGYHRLFERALGMARQEHPVLAGIPSLEGDGPVSPAAVREQGAGPVAAGLVALVAALIDLLGRIIGDEMAVSLVEQIAVPSPRRVVGSEIAGGRDG